MNDGRPSVCHLFESTDENTAESVLHNLFDFADPEGVEWASAKRAGVIARQQNQFIPKEKGSPWFPEKD
jgi:hypothetical protein